MIGNIFLAYYPSLGGGAIGNLLFQWEQAGVFSYVLPFLLIFAMVYGLLNKLNFFGKKADTEGKTTRGINIVIAVAVALMSLQFDLVNIFFAEIFPKFGVGIAVLVVLFLMVGLFYQGDKDRSTFYIIGLVLGVATLLWTISNWNFWGDYFGIGWWLQDNITIVFIGIAMAIAFAVVVGKKTNSSGDK